MTAADPARRPFGPGGPRVEGVERIAVLRGGGLGDLLFAMPALDSLAACYPGASITLLGTPMHAELLQGRPGPVGEVLVLPVAEGLRSAEGVEPDPGELAAFVAELRGRRLDLALQLHGGGRFSNPFLRSLGARVTAGQRTPDAEALDRSLPYVLFQQEYLRALEVAGLVGAAPTGLEPVVAVTDDDRARAARLLGGESGPLLVIHPGATDPRRRLPAERFGELAALAVARGARVAVVGDSGDSVLVADVLSAAGEAGAGPGRILDLAGRCDLGELVGVLAAATVFAGNDSGPRHLAQAVGTPTVSVYWIGNLITAGPLSRGRHRVHIGWVTSCPVCGVDVTQVGWTAERCEHEQSLVADVTAAALWPDVRELLG